jgi:hypothetical protein
MPLLHQPGSDDTENMLTTRTLYRPAGVKHEDTVKTKIDPTDSDPAVVKAQKKLDKMIAADAPASVLTRCRAKLADARTDFLEKVAEKRHKERSRVLAEQKEKIRRQHENEILFRLSAHVPVLSLTVAGLEVQTRPERANNEALRDTAWHDFKAVSDYVANMTAKAAGVARVAKQPLDAFPIDPEHFRHQVADIMRLSIRAGLTELIEVSEN